MRCWIPNGSNPMACSIVSHIYIYCNVYQKKLTSSDLLNLFLARLHEVQRAIVVTSVVRVYVYLYVRVILSVKVFEIVISR